jgi:drug/metabolite transporter (DMT)-like permease
VNVVLAFAVIYVVWGSTYLAIDRAVDTIPPLLMIGVRCLVAGGALLSWSLLRGAPLPGLAEWRGPLLAGGLLFLGGQGLLAWAEQRVPSGPASVVLATSPLFVALIDWKGGRLSGGRSTGRRPSAVTVAALVLGLLGVSVLMYPTGATPAVIASAGSGLVASPGSGALDTAGVLVLVVAAAAWSLGTFHAGGGAERWPLRRAGMQLVAGGGLLVAASAMLGELRTLELTDVTAQSLFSLLYLIVFGSLAGYGAYAWLLNQTTPARVSTHAYVNPVVALLLGWLAGGEALTPRVLAASALTLMAVAVAVSAGGRAKRRRWSRAHARSRAPVLVTCTSRNP